MKQIWADKLNWEKYNFINDNLKTYPLKMAAFFYSTAKEDCEEDEDEDTAENDGHGEDCQPTINVLLDVGHSGVKRWNGLISLQTAELPRPWIGALCLAVHELLHVHV